VQAFDLVGEAVLKPIWQISGKVAANDLLTDADRYRLADAIVKQTSPKEIIMTKQASTDKAGDAMTLADNADREYLFAAAAHRKQLQQNDMETLFDIARRLKKTVEAARAADARKPAATLSDTDHLAGHRPGWRLDDDNWRHDRRRRQTTTHEFDPEGREGNTYVTSGEDDEEDKKNGNRSEEALSDSKAARAEYLDYLHNAYKQGR
jgi:hypothetical protein